MGFEGGEGMRGAAGLGTMARRTKVPGIMDEVFHDSSQAPFAVDISRYARRVARTPHPGTSTRPFALSTDAPLAREEISKISDHRARMPLRKLERGAMQSTVRPWEKGGAGQDVGSTGVYTGVESVYLDRIRTNVIDPQAFRRYGDDSFKFPTERETGGFLFRMTQTGGSDVQKFQGVEMRFKTPEGRERMKQWTMRPWERDDTLAKEAARREVATLLPKTPGSRLSTQWGQRTGSNAGGGFQPAPRRPAPALPSGRGTPGTKFAHSPSPRTMAPFATQADHPQSVRASPSGYTLPMTNLKTDTFCP